MNLRFKAFDKISADDLDILIRDEATEQVHLEYKRELPGNEKLERIEVLKDISSFANARGGYIIYGMEEENGLPKKLVPIPKSMVDQEILRLTQMVESGIRPRIQDFRIRDIALPTGDCVLVAKIPQGFNRPHMVTYQNHSKFYSRNSKGVFQMDVDEIREMALSSHDLADRIRKFRNDRIQGISVGKTPISTSSGPYVVMHVIPFDSFSIGKNIDLSVIEENKEHLSILGHNIQHFRYNLDGVLGYHYSMPGKGEYPDGYIQIYRNGRIEILRTLWDWTQKYPKSIPAIEIENWILKSLESLLSIADEIEIDRPFSIGITLLDVKDYDITLLPWISGHIPPTAETIDRYQILIPEVIIEDFTASIESSMLPAFNSMWNSGAWPKSYTYNEDGTRKADYSWTKHDLSERFPV